MPLAASQPDPVRRALLRGRIVPGPAAIRPPGSRTEGTFAARCTRCEDCIHGCPERLLRRGAGGLPELDPSRGGCTFCGACGRACPVGLIDPEVREWDYRAVVGASCLSSSGVLCRVCGDRCPPGAIRFRLALGGRSTPVIDAACTGCGACVGPCPTGTITLRDPAASHPNPGAPA